MQKRADDPPRRQWLLQHQAGQHQAAERRAGRLDDAAVAERNKQIADIAQQRERQSAEQRERDRAPPA